MRVIAVRIETEIGKTVKYGIQDHPSFEPRQVYAEAHVRAESERQMLLRGSEDVEGVRMVPACFVVVGGAEARGDLCALRYCIRLRHQRHMWWFGRS